MNDLYDILLGDLRLKVKRKLLNLLISKIMITIGNGIIYITCSISSALLIVSVFVNNSSRFLYSRMVPFDEESF